MKKWSHIHSLVTGGTVGLIAYPHALVLFLGGFALGLGVYWIAARVRGAKRIAEQVASHPCLHCGRPVYGKASYCDQLCRRNAAREYAEKKSKQLALDDPPAYDPRTAEIPY